MPLTGFHPATAAWFARAFDAPTDVQKEAWPAIASGRHTLLAAPTGSGKTLAAFLAAIDALVREGLERGLPDQTRVLYISPLKALSNDIQKNLQAPLAGIRDELFAQGLLVVHEFVHYLQHASGLYDSHSCEDSMARERQAYYIQNEYILKAQASFNFVRPGPTACSYYNAAEEPEVAEVVEHPAQD